MRVSIITPTYNRADLLPETIESILSQDYPDLEYIVLDDGSRDSTPEVLSRYDERIVSVRHENMGETATVNKGFAMATGDIVCVVCSDDPVLPGLIRLVVEAFVNHPEALVVYPNWVEIGPSGEFLRMVRLPDYDIRTMLLTRSWGLGPGTFFRRSLLDKLGGRNPSRVYCGDMEFWALAAMLGPMVHIPRVLATHRTHPGSASVGQRGGSFAREWVDTWKFLLARTELPADVIESRSFVMGHVYLIASRHYCGNDRLQGWLYRASGWLRLWLIRHKGFGLPLALIRTKSRFQHARASFKEKLLRWAAPLQQRIAVAVFGCLLAYSRRKHRLLPGAGLGLPPICLRFAVCTRFTPPLWSGQAVVIGRLLDGLAADKYCLVSLPLYPDKQDDVDFTAALPGRRYLLSPEKQLRGASVLPARAREAWRQASLLYQAWQRGVNIARTVQEDGADTIVGCSGDLLDLPAAWVAARLLGRRFAVYFFDDYSEQWWADEPLKGFASRLEKSIVKAAGTIFVTNEYMHAEVARRHGRASVIIRNPAQSGSPAAFVTRFPSVPHEVRVVFTGAVYHLNYDILRATVAALSMFKGVLHRLHIYTAQPKAQLEAQGLSGHHVEIHDHVTPTEAIDIQRNADILLIPFSFTENAKGIVRTAATAKLADYLAAGRPILAICQEDAFLTWYLREQGCGLSVASDEPAAIARAIRSITEDAELRMRLQRNAQRAVLEEFAPVVSQRKLLETLAVSELPSHMRGPAPQICTGQLKVVQVSAMDLIGGQVNGFLAHKWLQEQGVDSRMLVHVRMSGDPCIREIGSPLLRSLNPIAVKFESKRNSTAILPLTSHRLDTDPWVRDADVVHIQLPHAAPFFSLLDLPRLSRRKRVLLSVHDMFFMTGHCTYPMDCNRWKTGCGQCPDLGLPFAITRDTTSRNWKLKRRIFERSNVDIVVGSPWQESRVRESPLLRGFRRHMIPYGVDTRVFKPADKGQARRRLGLPEDAHVIAFRSAPFHRNFKGTNFIEEALRNFHPRRPTVLLTFEGIGGLDDLRDKYQFLELGWVVDSEQVALGLQAADIFLMPSTAEAFGLMAIESMACGTPPIVFDGTALPDTIGGPECGVIVRQGDADGLVAAIEDCLENPEKLESYRRHGLNHATTKHGFDLYAKRYLGLYHELASEAR